LFHKGDGVFSLLPYSLLFFDSTLNLHSSFVPLFFSHTYAALLSLSFLVLDLLFDCQIFHS
jgi:hypothetical protein